LENRGQIVGRRTVLLIAALVVAALGTALVWMYANRADERAQADAEPVQVLVATADIGAGTSGAAISESASVALQTLPTSAVPTGALNDLTPVTDLVTLGPVFAGQVLLQQVFGTQQQSAGGLTLPEGSLGISIQLGDPQRVAGFVKPGSEVALFTTASGVGGIAEQQTTVLLPRVLVAAVGPTVVAQAAEGASNTEEIPTAILTLALTQEEAQRVILASQTTQLYMGLLDAQSEVDTDLPGTTAENLLD
jgi:pilus assembly protein CpaB